MVPEGHTDRIEGLAVKDRRPASLGNDLAVVSTLAYQVGIEENLPEGRLPPRSCLSRRGNPTARPVDADARQAVSLLDPPRRFSDHRRFLGDDGGPRPIHAVGGPVGDRRRPRPRHLGELRA